MPVTQHAIAKKLGISRSTVVQVLNGIGRVSPETRALVLRTAKEMGYRPNPFAQSLKTGKTNILAFWFYPAMDPYTAIVANKLQTLVPPYGLILTNLGLYKPNWTHAIKDFPPAEWPVDGIFAFDCGYVPPHVVERRPDNPPVIYITYDDFPEELDAGQLDVVRIKQHTGSLTAVRHLVQTRQRIAMLAVNPIFDNPNDGRLNSYQQVLREAGRPTEYIRVPQGRPYDALAKQALMEYVRQNGCPDAIFCASDDHTPAVHSGLHELGYDVPRDVALVGFDGLPGLEYHVPALSTIAQPFEAITQTAWEFMQNRLNNPDTPRQYAELEMQFVPRESSHENHRSVDSDFCVKATETSAFKSTHDTLI